MTETGARTARTAYALLGVLVAAFALSTVPGVRSGPGFLGYVDGWLQGTAYVVCAVVAALVAARSHQSRQLWALVASALALRALGFVLFLAHVRRQVPVPYPSVADAAWLAMAVVLLLALVLLVRWQVPRLSITLALDGLLAACATAGAAITVLFVALDGLLRRSMPAHVLATNLAYPVLDTALLVVLAGVLTALRWRPTPSVLVLSLGVLGFAVGDATFLYVVTTGSYHPGTWLASLSLVSTALIAVAGAVPDRVERAPADVPPPRLVVPIAFALVSLAVLAYASFEHVPLSGVALSLAALLVAMARAVLTLVGDRAVASAALDLSNEELLRFRALVEDSSDFIGMATLDGRIIYLNPGGRAMVGLAPDADISGIRIPDLLSKPALLKFQEEVRPNVRRLGAWQSESTLRDLRGGPPTPVASSTFLVRPVRVDGQPVMATVQRDITRRVADQQALQHLADARQDLLARLVQAQEDERASIAQDVHDDSVQALAAVDLRLGLLRRQLADQDSDLLASVDATLEAVTDATRRLRTLLFDLESPAQTADLATALAEAATYVFEETGVRWRITGDRTVDLPTPSRVTAYRVAKEALVNVRRHAGARHVEVDLGRDGDDVVVTVLDDGTGIRPEDLEAQPGHLGLAGMHDRTAITGGRVEVAVRPEGGTQVRLWVPGGTTSRVVAPSVTTSPVTTSRE